MLKDEIISVWLKMEQQLFTFINQRVKDEHASRDILQDVFLKIHISITNLRDDTKVTSWIFQITRNLITDHFRKTDKPPPVYIEDVIQPADFINESFNEALEDMIRMMDKLPVDYCEALCETELKGISLKEYSAKTGISYSGTKSRVQRAKKMLKEMLLNCCHYEFDKYGTVVSIQPLCYCCCPPK